MSVTFPLRLTERFEVRFFSLCFFFFFFFGGTFLFSIGEWSDGERGRKEVSPRAHTCLYVCVCVLVCLYVCVC